MIHLEKVDQVQKIPLISGAIDEASLALNQDSTCIAALKQKAMSYYTVNEFELARRDIDDALSVAR